LGVSEFFAQNCPKSLIPWNHPNESNKPDLGWPPLVQKNQLKSSSFSKNFQQMDKLQNNPQKNHKKKSIPEKNHKNQFHILRQSKNVSILL
jgi:hypothetical protein